MFTSLVWGVVKSNGHHYVFGSEEPVVTCFEHKVLGIAGYSKVTRASLGQVHCLLLCGHRFQAGLVWNGAAWLLVSVMRHASCPGMYPDPQGWMNEWIVKIILAYSLHDWTCSLMGCKVPTGLVKIVVNEAVHIDFHYVTQQPLAGYYPGILSWSQVTATDLKNGHP